MKVQKLPGLVVVTVEDPIVDVTNSERIASEILSAVDDSEHLVLDLAHVQFIDSSGLGKIVSLTKRSGEGGKQMGLCNVNQSVMVLFNMVKLQQIVSIFPDSEEAIRVLSA